MKHYEIRKIKNGFLLIQKIYEGRRLAKKVEIFRKNMSSVFGSIEKLEDESND